MKSQNLFSVKMRKLFQNVVCYFFLLRVLSVKEIMRMIVLSASYNMADIVYLYFLRLENAVISKNCKYKSNNMLNQRK